MAVTNFIPTLWSARLLQHLDNAHVYASLVNRDYEGEIRDFGDRVKISQVGDIEIKTYTRNTDIAAPDDLTGDQLTLIIDQAKYYNFACDDVDAAQVKPKLMDKAMQRAAYGLNDVADAYLASLLAAGATNAGSGLGNDTTPLVPTASTAYDMLVDLGTDLTEKNVPMEGRWVVVPAFFHGLLQKDPRFVGYGTDANRIALENGRIGRGAGFDIRVSNNVPATSTTSGSVTTVSKYKIVAGVNLGGSYAEQILKTEAYRPERRFADAVKGLHVYGAKVVMPEALSVLTVNKS